MAAAAALLIAVAVGLRGVEPKRVVLPRDRVDERRVLADPMQLLGPAAGMRASELDALVSEARRADFVAVRGRLFSLRSCPELVTWANTPDGQRFERLLNALRGGTKEDAFAAIVLLFRVARACEWKPGLLARTEHAEKLGAWLQDWLRSWGEAGVEDPLLSDASLSAALLYGKVMHVAWTAPLVGHNPAPYERALTFLNELLGVPPARRTKLGEALQARFPRTVNRLTVTEDALRGFVEECSALHPDLLGECGQ
jgi:hypothetical protein